MQSHKEQEDRIREVREELGAQSLLYKSAGARLYNLPEESLQELTNRIQEQISSQHSSANADSFGLSPLAGVSLYMALLSVLFLVYFPIDTGIYSQYALNNRMPVQVESTKVNIDDVLLQEMPEIELVDAYQEVLTEEAIPETDSTLSAQAYEDYLILHIDEHTLMQSLEP